MNTLLDTWGFKGDRACLITIMLEQSQIGIQPLFFLFRTLVRLHKKQ